jgi:hypothetical protein
VLVVLEDYIDATSSQNSQLVQPQCRLSGLVQSGAVQWSMKVRTFSQFVQLRVHHQCLSVYWIHRDANVDLQRYRWLRQTIHYSITI